MLAHWISSIYRGYSTQDEGNAAIEYNTFKQQYNENIYYSSTAESNLMSLSFESKAGIKTSFSDITFHLIDGDITAHRVILLSNPNSSLSLIPEEALYSESLTLDTTVSTFSILKRWLYTGTLSDLNDKINLLEWSGQYGEKSPVVQFCILGIINSRVAVTSKLVELAYKYKLMSLLNWLEWYLACNYDNFKREIKKLPAEIAGRVVKNEWPGDEYNEKLKAWKVERDNFEKLQSSKNQAATSNCHIQ